MLIQVGDRWLTPQQLRSTRAWRRLARESCPPGSICWICQQPIRQDVPPRHPLAPSADHIVPLEQGGAPLEPANVRPAHYGCNSSRSDNYQPETSSPDW